MTDIINPFEAMQNRLKQAADIYKLEDNLLRSSWLRPEA